MQTILGSTGTIGNELAKALTDYTNKIRLVSRNPHKINPTDEIVRADLLDINQTLNAVKGSEVVYLTIGLKYDISVWQTQWPIIINNVISACKQYKSKLVFFDNVYSYGKVDGWMREDTPINPCSKKGEARSKICQTILNEVDKGSIKAIIVRAADFYGPNTPLSFITVVVFQKLAAGKKAMWMGNDNVKHSFTYTHDAGKATALLGNTEKAYNQVWHLPTDKNVLTAKQMIEKIADEFNVKPSYTVLKKWMVQAVGFFNPIVKESVEMLYQNEYDYLFDSSKFEKAFNFTPTSYDEGIKTTAEYYKK
ncbi:MAG: NAD-dependent epimerase/dehydratase family protein [Ignavibacteriales bacterium]|nr:MAG: NAD-dependent epimerase/dehydratase family protein [Ignavibacteriales bacterium]